MPKCVQSSYSLLFCRLYRSLGDYDALRGIFSGHIGAQPITQKALEAEGRGDYAEALSLYNEVRDTSLFDHLLISSYKYWCRMASYVKIYCNVREEWFSDE